MDKYPVNAAVKIAEGKYAYMVFVSNLSEIVDKIGETNDLLMATNALLVDANGHLVDVNGNLVEIEGELVTINVVEGTITDAAVIGDNDGTISGKLRGISTQLVETNEKLDSVVTPSAIHDGLKLVTTAGTRETLVASSTPARSVTITAKGSNTGDVVVGGSTVVALDNATRRGTPLAAGDTMTMDIDDLQKIYIDTTVNGEGVTFTYTA